MSVILYWSMYMQISSDSRAGRKNILLLMGEKFEKYKSLVMVTSCVLDVKRPPEVPGSEHLVSTWCFLGHGERCRKWNFGGGSGSLEWAFNGKDQPTSCLLSAP